MYTPTIESIPRRFIIEIDNCGQCRRRAICEAAGRTTSDESVPDHCGLYWNITRFPQLITAARSLIVNPDRELFQRERAVIDWQYGFSGDFFRNLFAALAKADGGNLVRLYHAFPEETLGYVAYGHAEGWWPAVQNKARKLGIL